MRSLAAAMSGILLLLALPTMAQSQGTDGEEPELPGRVLCFQVEALFVRVRDQAERLEDDYHRICTAPPASGATCYEILRQSHGKELDRLYRYRRWGNALRQEYGNMCGGALNETLKIIVDALDYVTAN